MDTEGTHNGVDYRLRTNRWGGLDVSTGFGIVRTRREGNDWWLRLMWRNETLIWEAWFSEDTPEAVRHTARVVALGMIRISGLDLPNGAW